MERHGTEIFDLVRDKDFLTKEEIITLTKSAFGDDVTFYTCGDSNLTPEQLLDFFIKNNKFEKKVDKYKFYCEGQCS